VGFKVLGRNIKVYIPLIVRKKSMRPRWNVSLKAGIEFIVGIARYDIVIYRVPIMEKQEQAKPISTIVSDEGAALILFQIYILLI
jgi:hypothetical protein